LINTKTKTKTTKQKNTKITTKPIRYCNTYYTLLLYNWFEQQKTHKNKKNKKITTKPIRYCNTYYTLLLQNW